jgi:hypothetical protein
MTAQRPDSLFDVPVALLMASVRGRLVLRPKFRVKSNFYEY